jgi:pimeloyl-ACP methyl ester carboxylesterase
MPGFGNLFRAFIRLRRPHLIIMCTVLALLGIVLLARWDAYRAAHTPVSYELEQRTSGDSKELIVFVHGFVTGKRALLDVVAETKETRPDADILVFEYPASLLSNASPFLVAAQIEERIRDIYQEHSYESIHLVGYSMGALLIRKAYVYGSGSVEDLPFADGARRTSRPPQPWVKAVDRIVLLAGTNRGWSHDDPPKDLSLTRSIANSIGMRFAKITGTGTLVRGMQRGEPFVANLRLQWLDVMHRAQQGTPEEDAPTIVQLLGDKDTVVSKEDDRDVTVAKNFIWVGVHNSTHGSIVDLTAASAGTDRKRKILQALGSAEDIEALRQATISPQRDEDPDVTTVVFVLHGIRDIGDWTSAFEEPLQNGFRERQAGSADKIYVHRAGYGYFPMGPFLLWADRQRNVRWFMDQVTELKSRFPNLQHIHFIGHSNGTYVLASALENYATLNVDRVVFAGSVVPRSYNWSALAGRVESVRNYVGLDDMVVGVFPRLFELPFFRWINPDLGSAGFNGFEDGRFKHLETQFLRGGHGAALHPDNVQGIVDFVLDGRKVDADTLVVSERPARLSYISQLCWAVWLLLIGAVLGLGFVVLRTSAIWHTRRLRQKVPRGLFAWITGSVYAMFMILLLYTV